LNNLVLKQLVLNKEIDLLNIGSRNRRIIYLRTRRHSLRKQLLNTSREAVKGAAIAALVYP
jgi:hypothetical protein